MAKKAKLLDEEDSVNGEYNYDEQIECFAKLIAAAEREACAKLCEQADDDEFYFGRQYADAIRARGTK
jgi:hypothetical protein